MSQFTLLAQTKKGSKPDFHGAAGGDKARELYNHFVDKVKEYYQPEKVKNGIFQAMMQVELVNDGPVGVDYRCDDGEVNLKPLHHPLIQHPTDGNRSPVLGDTGDSNKPTQKSRSKAKSIKGRERRSEQCFRDARRIVRVESSKVDLFFAHITCQIDVS